MKKKIKHSNLVMIIGFLIMGIVTLQGTSWRQRLLLTVVSLAIYICGIADCILTSEEDEQEKKLPKIDPSKFNISRGGRTF